MQGLELAKAYYEAFGKPMLEEQFSCLLPHIAVGLCGSGSECLGYDDGVSVDHDFEPGYCIFLPSEEIVDRRQAFLLERAYAKQPREFMGFRRSLVSPVGGTRRGVIRLEDFLHEKTGKKDGMLSGMEWLLVPEQSLAECTNGEVFHDGSGALVRVREYLSYFPEDARRKKLAGALFIMGQAGQYNYSRILRHGETGAAQLAVFEFTKAAISAIFLLNKKYQPYYKWGFRAMRTLRLLSIEAELLEYLITSDNEGGVWQEKQDVMEGIAADIVGELAKQGLGKTGCLDLEKQAYAINDSIASAQLRNLHILSGVQS